MAIEIVSFPAIKWWIFPLFFVCLPGRVDCTWIDHPKVEPLEIPGKPHQDHPIEGLEENDSRNPNG